VRAAVPVTTGSCLCGDVRYAVGGALGDAHHCHCSRCRKAHGAAFATYAGVAVGDLRVTAVEGALRRFRSSPEVVRSFCGRCGSTLFFATDAAPGRIWIAAGTLDDGAAPAVKDHIFVGSKAPWHEITDELPQFAEYPPHD
jgi:hypothetical protein